MKTRIPVSVFALLAVSAVFLQADPKNSTPFSGKPAAIPGLIEAEHWDKGPAGVAYSDADEENKGEDYREKTSVDIEKRSDASNGHGIGWTRAEEWLVYTVEVTEPGTYTVEMPVASKKKGGTFRLEFDGKAITEKITIPDTGSWQKLEMISCKTVPLKKGVYRMKVVMLENGESTGIGDIDYFKFVKVDS
ncbi:MAG: carbohydrate-binding protein [Verrucomicrobiales bacterium]|nr:carbohydrate-binding protein [Verrucomicrobiales bacterium]